MKAENRNLIKKKPQNPLTSEMLKEATQNKIEQISKIHVLWLLTSASWPKNSCTHPFVRVKTDPVAMVNCGSVI